MPSNTSDQGRNEPDSLRQILPHAGSNDPVSGPYNIEAEQQLIGAILCNNEVLSIVGGLTEQAFFDPVHAELFRRIKALVDNGQLASPVTMKSACEGMAHLADLGGPTYLVRLAGAAMPRSYAKDYMAMLLDLQSKRELLAVTRQAQALINDGRSGSSEIASGLETSVGKLMVKVSAHKLTRSYAAATMNAIDTINASYQNEAPSGVSTGLPQLDRQLGNLRAGQMIILAGRPSMGKTTVAQNFAYHAMTSGVGVFYGSLEMPGEELSPRFLSKGLYEKGKDIPYDRMIRGELTEQEFRDIVDEAKSQIELPLILGERDVREVGRMRSAVRRAKQQLDDTSTPLGLVIIDYVQLLSSSTAKSTYDRASEASDTVKDIAMTLGVPVVALAQLSRAVEQRDPPVPMLSDLRETGKLEEDADVVMFCYRDAYYLQRKLDAAKGGDLSEENDLRLKFSQVEKNLDLIVAKQRSGRLGTVQAFCELGSCHISADRAGQRTGDQYQLM